ncbi:hypothetical protein POM88_012933 [Heracleum sosnowskyi]|uniref:Uncharacterized protein n=1 Tax=Heracleum sosnowskyi TaxID=360622 RepID=A0AAD8IXC0_9APIA|nr:hypothetical protein POM88_012933 [Heracleum sosnowskyi]
MCPEAILIPGLLQRSRGFEDICVQKLACSTETVPLRTVNGRCSSDLQAVADVADIGIIDGLEFMTTNYMGWVVNPRVDPHKKAASAAASEKFKDEIPVHTKAILLVSLRALFFYYRFKGMVLATNRMLYKGPYRKQPWPGCQIIQRNSLASANLNNIMSCRTASKPGLEVMV